MTIRFATQTDAPQLLPLFEQLGYPISLELLTRKIGIYTDHEHYGLLVAEIDARVVGIIALAFTDSIIKDACWCRIEVLVIDANYRRQGIGRALMARAEELAKEHNCHGIDLVTLVRRASSGTHDFYRSLGYGNQGEDALLYLQKKI